MDARESMIGRDYVRLVQLIHPDLESEKGAIRIRKVANGNLADERITIALETIVEHDRQFIKNHAS